MIKVGLTGNIGSGKTVVAQVFSKLGVPVFFADTEARKLYNNEEIRIKIKEIFGNKVFSASGQVLTPMLAEIVFQNQELLEQLNRIIHPAVRQYYQDWINQNQSARYTIYEAAILFESGHYLDMDKVICVIAPEEVRIKRVILRDHVSRQDVEKRIANQWPEERKTELSDYVIRNDGSEMVIEQVLAVHGRLMGI
jgi:dephospho-CoA kinase